MSSIFLSHSHADKLFVRKLGADLRQHGIVVWVDEAEILVGDSLIEKISSGIAQTEYLGVVLSAASVHSEWVRREVEMALTREIAGRRVRVLPLVLDDSPMPSFLAGKLYADFRNRSKYRQAVKSLLARLLSTATSPPALTERTQTFEPDLAFIPAGKFLMGSDPRADPASQEDEQPQHAIELPAYYLGKSPVTMSQYWTFVDATERDPPRGWRDAVNPPHSPAERFQRGVPLRTDVVELPVNWVTWFDAVAFCLWLSRETGKIYRLPSEAEWEKGARGTDGWIYPWGNEWIPERCQADRQANLEPTYVGDHVIGGTRVHVDTYRLGQSPFGLCHMAGNVQDWTRTVWRFGDNKPFGYPYNPNDGRESEDTARALLRVVRGGGFLHKPAGVRCAFRDGRDPSSPAAYGGFRVLRAFA